MNKLAILLNNIQGYKRGGSSINIKKSHEGKFRDYCGGKVTKECIKEGKSHCGKPGARDKEICRMATFADNSRHFVHGKEHGGMAILRAFSGGGKVDNKEEQGNVSMETLGNIMDTYNIHPEEMPELMNRAFHLMKKMEDSGHFDYKKAKDNPTIYFPAGFFDIVSKEDVHNPAAWALVTTADIMAPKSYSSGGSSLEHIFRTSGINRGISDNYLANKIYNYSGGVQEGKSNYVFDNVIGKNMNKINKYISPIANNENNTSAVSNHYIISDILKRKYNQ